jgi:hypothetical protein
VDLFPCAAFLFGIFVVLFLVAVILRAAVWMTNKCTGDSSRPAPVDDDEEEDWDAYDRPRRPPPQTAIPEPGVFKGMAITLVVFIANFIVLVVLAAVLEGVGGGPRDGFGRRGRDPGFEFLGGVCSLTLGFVVWAGLLSALLPASFGRGCLVTLFVYLIFFVIFMVVGVILVAAAPGFGGFR